jgi:hypothetical protein
MGAAAPNKTSTAPLQQQQSSYIYKQPIFIKKIIAIRCFSPKTKMVI